MFNYVVLKRIMFLILKKLPWDWIMNHLMILVSSFQLLMRHLSLILWSKGYNNKNSVHQIIKWMHTTKWKMRWLLCYPICFFLYISSSNLCKKLYLKLKLRHFWTYNALVSQFKGHDLMQKYFVLNYQPWNKWIKLTC